VHVALSNEGIIHLGNDNVSEHLVVSVGAKFGL